MQINSSNLVKEIGEKLDLPKEEVEKAIKSHFEFLRNVMTNEPEKSVRLKRFGIFVNKKKYLDKKVKRAIKNKSKK